MEWHFEIEEKVREYECDLQGIVNNAVYLNYLEHARDELLRQQGLELKKLHDQGIDAVVARIEVDYKWALRPGDEFVVRINLEREGELKLMFRQEIRLKGSDKLCTKAVVTVVFLVNGRLGMPQVVLDSFKALL